MNASITRAAEGLGRRAFTIADTERMVEVGILDPDERLELVGGEIVPMAAKGSRHEAIKVALTLHWGRVCPAEFAFAQETGLRLDPQNYLEPDFIVFACTKRLADIKGPDVLLAVEVADSSLDYDLQRKPLVYAAFGVREYWVIDAARRVVHRHEGATPDDTRMSTRRPPQIVSCLTMPRRPSHLLSTSYRWCSRHPPLQARIAPSS